MPSCCAAVIVARLLLCYRYEWETRVPFCFCTTSWPRWPCDRVIGNGQSGAQQTGTVGVDYTWIDHHHGTTVPTVCEFCTLLYCTSLLATVAGHHCNCFFRTRSWQRFLHISHPNFFCVYIFFTCHCERRSIIIYMNTVLTYAPTHHYPACLPACLPPVT